MFLSRGTVDLAFARQYAPVVLVANRLVSAPVASREAPEDEVVLQGARVRITDADGNVLDEATIPGDGFIPWPTDQPGLAAFATTLVTSRAAEALGAFSGTRRLISYVAVSGVATHGTHVESGELGFPIDACYGCLVAFPDTADDPTSAMQPNCDAPSPSTLVPPCVLGQDQPIDCRLCASTGAPFAPANTNVCEP